MTKRDFISIFIKIIGISFICSTIIGLPFAIAKIGIAIATLIILSVVLIIGLSLILLANKITNKLVSANKELKVIGGDIRPKDVFITIMRIIWMFSIVFALEYFIGMFLGIKREKMWIISNILTIIIGIYFLLGAKHIVKFIFERESKRAGQTESNQTSINI
ncbi:MAG: hypothetical protein QME51_11040 [Planctomycetota bacterium]|nr:hypothetical protein [Planctomycetota bacterium]